MIRARDQIDARLAEAGWHVQDKDALDFNAGHAMFAAIHGNAGEIRPLILEPQTFDSKYALGFQHFSDGLVRKKFEYSRPGFGLRLCHPRRCAADCKGRVLPIPSRW